MNRITYPLSAFVSSGGQIYTDSLDSAVVSQPSIEAGYLYSIFNEGVDQSSSSVDFYFDSGLNGGQLTDLGSVVASYNGQPGFTGQPGQYMVADLPMRACNDGDSLWAIDGRKVGEGVGAGTGVPVYWSGSNWLVFSTDSPVQV